MWRRGFGDAVYSTAGDRIGVMCKVQAPSSKDCKEHQQEAAQKDMF
jgi:hypothetical protein